jgi:iron complex transport system substrate-binding protein
MARLRGFALLALLVLASVCGGSTPLDQPIATSTTAAYPVAVVDDRGKEHLLALAPERIVSLSPSATEVLFTLGAADRLIATDDSSDYPPAAKALPKLGGLRDAATKAATLAPDLVIVGTQSQLRQLDGLTAPTYLVDPANLEGVYRDILALGTLIDRRKAADDLVGDMRSRIQYLAQRVKQTASRPRVLHEVDATNPQQIYVAGPENFIDEMINTVGGTNVAADAETRFPRLNPEEIVRRDPQILVLADHSGSVTPELVAGRPGWSSISAVRSARVYLINPDLVSRTGPRLVLGYEAYARFVHPEIFGP